MVPRVLQPGRGRGSTRLEGVGRRLPRPPKGTLGGGARLRTGPACPWRALCGAVASVASAALLLGAALLSGCANPGHAPAGLRLVNWNTYHLFDHRAHLAPATEWLAQGEFQVAALQELVQTTEEELLRLASAWSHPHAVLHKESGYAVGLTSTAPIEVVERRVEGFHHGFLHARTHGLDLFVVHFWPGKIHEAELVAERAASLARAGGRVLVLGDFNGEIRSDEPWLREQGTLGEVVEGQRVFDFRITDAFLSRGLIDLIHEHDPEARYTFGSPALIPRWSPDMEHVEAKRRRIDFAMASPSVAALARGARVETDDASVGRWSDHYPLLIDLARPWGPREAPARASRTRTQSP